MPGYASVRDAALAGVVRDRARVGFEGSQRVVPLRRGTLGRVEVALVDDPLVAGRGPYDYADPRDEAFRYGLLCRVPPTGSRRAWTCCSCTITTRP
jgi:hypothetical protein